MPDDDEYKVGPYNPPKETRFSSTHQPKNRRSRAGRPGVRTTLKKALSTPLTVKRNGRKTKVPPLDFIVDSLKREACDAPKMALAFLALVQDVLGVEDLDDAKKPLNATDLDLIAAWAARHLADQQTEETDPTPPPEPSGMLDPPTET